MSLFEYAEIKKATSCDRCGECMGPCPNCGAYLDHDEGHATDCTAEQDYKDMLVAWEEGD